MLFLPPICPLCLILILGPNYLQVAFLHDELSSMGALLEDLADMEDLDNQTKQWRNKVREMSYDIEDCLDEFMHRIGGSDDGKGLLNRLKTLRARHQLANQIQELKARVQEASARRMRYKLDNYPSRSSNAVVNSHVRDKLDDYASGSSNVVVDPRMTSLYTQSSRLVGIDGPKEEIINLLSKQVGILYCYFGLFVVRYRFIVTRGLVYNKSIQFMCVLVFELVYEGG